MRESPFLLRDLNAPEVSLAHKMIDGLDGNT